ncbi:hypothetical protein BDZ94DRAFT_1303642 [Collybia nuda]|uniref:Uncharacterized protein n=1 Tax=Collybia nuda TaxID=64659 RepID=A0A9P5YHI1_9AGAR|nr:hypothetical protein BDZ94DRAFT_1303642 [Collybia nuda]
MSRNEQQSASSFDDRSNVGGDFDTEFPSSVVPTLCCGAPLAMYQEALKDAQIRYSNLRAAYQHSKKSKATVTTFDEDVQTYAKKFTALYELFVPTTDGFFSQDQPADDILSVNRYDTAASQALAILAEIYSVFPQHLHDFIHGHSQFNDMFQLNAKNMRSMLVERVRDVISGLLGLPAEYFKASYDRSKVPELQALLKFDINSSSVSKFAPILYPIQYRKKRNDTKLFLAPELPLLLKAILFGKASLSRQGSYPKRRTLGVQWGVTQHELPFGGMATVAVLAIFLVSPDMEFGPKGARSGIDYQKFFNAYKKLFFDGSRSGSLQIQQAIAHFDRTIFIGATPTAVSNDDSGAESEIELGLEDMTFDDSDQMGDTDVPISRFSSASGNIPSTDHRPISTSDPIPIVGNKALSAPTSNCFGSSYPSILSQQQFVATMASTKAPPSVSDSESELSSNSRDSSMYDRDTSASASAIGAKEGVHLSVYKGADISVIPQTHIPPPPVPTTTKPISQVKQLVQPGAHSGTHPAPMFAGNLMKDIAPQAVPAPKEKRVGRARLTKNKTSGETGDHGLPILEPRRTGRVPPKKHT